MSDQVNTSEKTNAGPIESVLDGEMTAYINGFIEQNAGKIIAAAEEKARQSAQRIIDKAREKAEAEVDRIIFESRAEMEKNAELTIKEAEEKVSWFVLEVSAHVMEEAQILKKDIVNRLVEKRSNQIIAKAQEKARSAAQEIVVKAREKAEAEAHIIIQKAREAADKSVQEIAKSADDEASRMTMEIRDTEKVELKSENKDVGKQSPEDTGSGVNVTEVVGNSVQEVAVRTSQAVVEVPEVEAVEAELKNQDVDRQLAAANESGKNDAQEVEKNLPEKAAEVGEEIPGAVMKADKTTAMETQVKKDEETQPMAGAEYKETAAEDKFKGRVIEFVPENNGGKDKAAELAKEELIPAAPPPPENAAPAQESAEAGKTEEPSIVLKNEGNEDFFLYKDLVQLTLPPPIALDHMLKLHKQLKSIPNVKVMELTGSLDKGVKIELFLTTPVPLLGLLKAIPEVEKALDLNEKKPVPAGHQKDSELTPHAIVIKMKK